MGEVVLTPAQEELRALVNDAAATHQYLDVLAALTDEQRERLAEALRTGHRQVRLRIRADRSHHLLLAAAVLEASPAIVAATLGEFTVWRLQHATVRTISPLDFVVDHLKARGQGWVEQFVAAVVKRRASAETASPIVDPLLEAFQLPLPSAPRYWMGWVRDGATPGPGIRWQQRFIAACEAPNAFSEVEESQEEFRARIGNRLRYLRRGESTDDAALLGALIQVFERGDRAKAQRVALWWFALLGLEPYVAGMSQRMIAALPTMDSTVAAAMLPQLLAAELSADELSEVALVMLPRKQTKPKRAVLRMLGGIPRPADEVVETVRALADGTDVAMARLAAEVLAGWGVSQETKPELLGLWREPSLASQPLPEPTALNDAELAELISRVGADSEGQPELFDETLAALTVTAYRRGGSVVRQAMRDHLDHRLTGLPLLRTMLIHTARRTSPPPIPNVEPLAFLSFHLAQEMLGALGRLPCLLSTPSHRGFRVSWQALAHRVAEYRRLGAELLPTDVAIALARLDLPSSDVDLESFAVPIQGVAITLDEVIRAWQDVPAAPGQWRLTPKASLPGHSRFDVEVSGDVPATHSLLGLRNAWSVDYRPKGGWRFGGLTALCLAPQHPTRPAAWVLGSLMDAAPSEALRLFEVFLTATRWDPIVGVLTFAIAATTAPKQRDQVAAALLGVWEEGRVTAEDLLLAWHDERRILLAPSPAKVFATLDIVAEAGGLALVWPLLVTIAEEQCALAPVPAATGQMLERLLAYLPEVQAAGVAVELPGVTALAAGRGKSKIITVAQMLVKGLD